MRDEVVQWAVAGDRVSLFIPVEELVVPVGSMICDDVPPIMQTIIAQVQVFDTNLTMGMPLLFHHLSSSTPTKLVKIWIDGKIKRSLPAFKIGKVELFVERGVFVDFGDTFSKSLQRFTLRCMSSSVAAGLIVKE